MPNELGLGSRRVGDLIDFNVDTPPVKVTLERSSRGISLTVSWSDEQSPYAGWFLDGDGIHPPRTEDRVPVPSRVLFQDSHGSVLVIRCWARGFHSNLLGPGSGTLWGRAAILGVDENVDFERPHGLQTEIAGLREWLAVTSWQQDYERTEAGLVATITSVEVPPIHVAAVGPVTLSFQPGWQVLPEERRDRRIVLDLLRCETRSEQPVGWDDHLHAHRAVRDLLVLSRWHDESCVVVRAMRADDPLRTLDGVAHGEQWRDVVVTEDTPATEPSGFRPHLITFAELGQAGLARWLTLRDQFARAFDPVISSIGLRGTTADALLAQTGPGLEALGYLLMVRDGQGAQAAARATLQVRFARILDDLGDVLPFDADAWVSNTIAAYNGLKHANRDAPDPVDVLNAWRESVLVVRAWVATELGIPSTQVKERLGNDPQRHAYVMVGK